MLTELQNFSILQPGDRFGVVLTGIVLLAVFAYMLWHFPKKKPSSNHSQLRSVMGEFVGTFFLAMAVYSGGFGMVAGSLAAGLVIAVLVYLFAPVSSAHFNPAVTITAFLAKYISARRALVYLVTQCVAAYTAMWLYQTINVVTLSQLSSQTVTATSAAAIFAEFIGAALLLGVVATVVYRKESLAFASMIFAVAVVMAPIVTGMPAFINPAIALAIGGGWATIVMPILGGIVGMLVAYSLTIERDQLKVR